MSIFGKWECPNCGSTWVGSIGWDWSVLEDQKRLDNLLQTMCGCEKVDNPEHPLMSSSFTQGVESDKRKQLLKNAV